MDFATSGDPAFQQPMGEASLEAVQADEGSPSPGDTEPWRQEVAARLERYRARRKPRAPRYPSLFLPFDSSENRARSMAAVNSAAAPAALLPRTDATPQNITLENVALENVAFENSALAIEKAAAAEVEASSIIPELFDSAAKIIEFPRSAAIPVFRAPELADPVLERPRIVEAPEMVPPPPALGGILMEPTAAREPEKKAGSEVPVSPATIPQRLTAGLVDGLICGAALAAFGTIFARLNPQIPPLLPLVGSSLAVATLLWCAYKFLFVVYTGSTPGTRALKLSLVRFDGSHVTRNTRRWRVLASFLSMFSLGLGYLWGFLDEDGLCWHDRITRTYLRVQSPTQ